MRRPARGPAGGGRNWERARDIGALRPLRGSSAVTRSRAPVAALVRLEAERVRAGRFAASYDGDARGLVARAWDLDGLAARLLPAASRFVDCCLRPGRRRSRHRRQAVVIRGWLGRGGG